MVVSSVSGWLSRASTDDGPATGPARPSAKPRDAADCSAVDRFFADEVWAKVGERTCWKCHNPEGEAAESRFILAGVDGPGARDSMRHNCQAFASMARTQDGQRSRLLAKVIGGLEHGGGRVLKPDSTEYGILERFVRRAMGEPVAPMPNAGSGPTESPPFFEGVTMFTPRRLLRRVTLSLSGRLPTDREMSAVNRDGLAAVERILGDIMREDAFYTRLKEGFNDIFLTLGIEGNAEGILSYEHFEHTRLWTEKYDLDHVPEAERQRARWKLADDYRKALLGEPMKLIEYIVRNDRPFTEIATADYIMVSPYTARGYGIFDEVKGQFKNPDDPFEYIPVKLKALKGRAGRRTRSRATGMYPHAGFLEHVPVPAALPDDGDEPQSAAGADVLSALPRRRRPGAGRPRVGRRRGLGEVQDPDDAGGRMRRLPQDDRPGRRACSRISTWKASTAPARAAGTRTCSPPGFEGEKMPASERWRRLQWLGERTAKDPRFAVAMVEHVYYILTGRKVLLPPKDIEDPLLCRAAAGVSRTAAADRGNRRAVRASRGSTSRMRSRTGSSSRVLPRRRRWPRPVPTPGGWPSWTTSASYACSRPSRSKRKVEAIFGKAGAG